ncbi:MAG: Ig-like domain-containing protein [Flavobacteriaceae bacterium]|nr:Ig-like domain-containing protein [Flavobacteriaceae bacterium]MDG2314356.1 Ig-like domain-containing protein [Flavobacteriaceae bacterium]
MITLTLVQCAKRGTPTGGIKDEIPPVLLKSNPPLLATGFNAKRIRLHFDEFIKLKDIRKQLIVSPPIQEGGYSILPMSGASKYIQIDIKDTLEPNTTYAFNFGQSVVDNNEGNPFPYFRYVFSTGDYIDSLFVTGEITDALKRQPESFVSVMLFAIDSTYSDSVIYKQPPAYLTNTLDSSAAFRISNVKAGKYLLAALKDVANNYTFDQNIDKIAFYPTPIELPQDSLVESLTLFQEETNFRATRPFVISKNRIGFGFRGRSDSLDIKLTTPMSSDFESILTADEKTDTLYYWFRDIENDSLVFSVNKKDYTLKLNTKEPDSLSLSVSPKGTLPLSESLFIKSNTPLVAKNDSLITILNQDSIPVSFSAKLLENHLDLKFDFEVVPNEKYRIELLPNALTDFFGSTNDTLQFGISTKSRADYGAIRLRVGNPPSFPFIIQLTNEKEEVVREQIIYEERGEYSFENLTPSKYYVRVIIDENNNGKWDTGSFLSRTFPEPVFHYAPLLDVRANWDLQETFILD